MVGALALVARVAAGLFTGAALYITLVGHPSRLALGSEAAVAEFRESFPRAARMQGGLALTTLVTATVVAAQRGGWIWAAGGVTVGAVVPWTLLVMQEATNRDLLEADLTPGEAAPLLQRWGRLHAVRTLLGAAGFLLLLLARRP